MMGGLFTNLWWGGNPDIPNPQTGLTRRDIYHVQSSWALVYKDRVDIGCKLFIGIFTAYPESKKLFKSFKDIPTEDLPEIVQFRVHVVIAISTFNIMFDNLDQPGLVSAMMERLADTHITNRVESQHFKQMEKMIVQILKDGLKLNETYLQSWDKAITYLFKFAYRKLEDTK